MNFDMFQRTDNPTFEWLGYGKKTRIPGSRNDE
jgi:hypothetical protein